MSRNPHDMTKYIEARTGLNHRLPEFPASLVVLRPWGTVKNAKGWAVCNQDVQAPLRTWLSPIPSSFRLPPVLAAS